MNVKFWEVRMFVDETLLNGLIYRYHQVDDAWQRNACIRMGLQFVKAFKFQSGGADVILTQPNLRALHNVQGDGNCLFRAMSYIITGSENQHMEVRLAILRYMLSIENLLVGYDRHDNYNYLQPFGHTSVQSYIDSRNLTRASTWGSEFEMICLSHMLHTVIYSFEAQSKTWQVFAYQFIDRELPCDYTGKSIYLWFGDRHFKMVTSARKRKIFGEYYNVAYMHMYCVHGSGYGYELHIICK